MPGRPCWVYSSSMGLTSSALFSLLWLASSCSPVLENSWTLLFLTLSHLKVAQNLQKNYAQKKKVSFILNIAWVLLLYACLCESYLSKLVVSFLKVSDKDFSKSGCFNEKIVFKIILSFKWTLLWLEKKPTSTLYTEKFKTELNIFYKIKIWSCTYALCLGIDNSVGILRELSSSLKLLNWIFKMILQDDF